MLSFSYCILVLFCAIFRPQVYSQIKSLFLQKSIFSTEPLYDRDYLNVQGKNFDIIKLLAFKNVPLRHERLRQNLQ